MDTPPVPASINAAGENAEAAWVELLGDLDPTERTAHRLAGTEALALQIGRMRDAAQDVAENGLVIIDADGKPHPNPAIETERDAQAEIRSWTNRLM